MRLLVLVLNIVVSVSLTAYSPDMLAAKHKSGHNKGKRYHSSSGHKVIIRDPGNVWDRIRFGMRLPMPAPPQAFSSLSPVPSSFEHSSPAQSAPDKEREQLQIAQAELASKYTRLGMQHQLLSRNRLISPGVASAPLQNYTRYGRQRLNTSRYGLGYTNTSIARALQGNSRHLLQPSSTYLAKDATGGMRIHTQLAPPSASSYNRSDSRTDVIANRNEPPVDAPKINQSTNNPTPNSNNSLPPSSNVFAQQRELMDKQRAKDEEIWQQQASIYGRVKKQINSYAQKPDYLHRIAERARPYLYHVVEELGQHNMPMELALLPVVESAYQATAQSPMSAAGIWQFIPGTGRDFDLVQNNHYDARLDIAASTRAAVRFLSGLKNHFNGDWLLALAAYNCGQGTVDAAIRANVAAGLKTDYWSLNLPQETMDYVPKLLAVAHIFSSPHNYGLNLNPIRNEPYFVKVHINRKADIDYLAGKSLTTVAQLADMNYDSFHNLNPGYISGTLAHESLTFLMPGGNANQLRDRLDSIAKFMGKPTQSPKNAPIRMEQPLKEADPIPAAITEAISATESAKPATVDSPFISLDVGGSQNKTTPSSVPSVINGL